MKTHTKIVLLALLFIMSPSLSTAAEVSKKNIPKKSERGPKDKVIYSIVPFDLSTEKLPERYMGHSILDIYQKLSIPHSKGEFENSEEYEARVTRWKLSPILGKLTPSDTLAFEISERLAPDAVKYDADKEELTVKVAFETQYFISAGQVRWRATYYRYKNLGKHTGVTRMGVKFMVTSHSGTSVGIGIKEQIEPISISKQLTRDEAVRIKPLIRVYAIGTIDEPYKITESKSSRTSLDDPNEWFEEYFGLYVNLKAIWIVNTLTGELIAKSEAPFQRCRYDICN